MGQDNACRETVSRVATSRTVVCLVQHGHWACLPVREAVALMQHPAISGTEVQQQGPVGTSALYLPNLYPHLAIAAQACLRA